MPTPTISIADNPTIQCCWLIATAQRSNGGSSGAVQGVSAVEETPVFANGQTFRLGDIARVVGTAPDDVLLAAAEACPSAAIVIVDLRDSAQVYP